MKTIVIGLTILAVVLLGMVITQPTEQSQQTPQPKPEIIIPPLATDVEASLNQFRISKGLPALDSNVVALDEAAQARAEYMCANNTWSHYKDWATLSQYYNYAYAGENLYYDSLQKNQVNDAIESWSLSPSHLKNMVGEYTQVGVAVKSCPGFQGNETAVIITNYFGVPR